MEFYSIISSFCFRRLELTIVIHLLLFVRLFVFRKIEFFGKLSKKFLQCFCSVCVFIFVSDCGLSSRTPISNNVVTLCRAHCVTIYSRISILVCSQSPRSTQPSSLCGTVKWVSAFTGWVIATVSLDDSSLQANSQHKSVILDGWRLLGAQFAFIIWTKWTHAMAVDWWHHCMSWYVSVSVQIITVSHCPLSVLDGLGHLKSVHRSCLWLNKLHLGHDIYRLLWNSVLK